MASRAIRWAHSPFPRTHVGLRPDHQVQVAGLGRVGALGVDADALLGIFRVLGTRLDAAIEHRMGPGGVVAAEDEEVGLRQVVIDTRDEVGTEGLLVRGDGRRHAQARIGVDIGRADIAFGQLVDGVIVFGEQLARYIKGHRVRAVFVDYGVELLRHGVEGLVPGDGPQRAVPAHPGFEQPAFQPEGFTKRRAFRAEAPGIGRMGGVALDRQPARAATLGRHAAAHPTIGGRWCGRWWSRRRGAWVKAL